MEEDIDKLQKLIDRCKECKFATCEQCEINWTEVQAIENLIARYKELEECLKAEESYSKSLNNDIKSLLHIEPNDNFIPKSKVKEKIEEIKNTGIDVAWEQINYSIKEQDRAKIQVLQELLEES